MMPGDLKDLLRVFSAHWVKYLVVGGYAYGVHAEPRATKDLDIFISRDEGNSEAVFRALIECGAPLDGLSASDFRDGSHFQIGQPPARVDLLQEIDGITFDEAWNGRVEAELIPAPVSGRDGFPLYRCATLSSRSKNSGNEIAADSAPRISVSPSARSAATANAMAMR